MEFLAESIGLLDLDGEGAATVRSTPQPRQPNIESDKPETTAPKSYTAGAFAFFGWGESSDPGAGEEGGSAAAVCDGDTVEGGCSTNPPHEADGGNDDADDDDDNDGPAVVLDRRRKESESEQEGELDMSAQSLLSSMTPSSPLTLSASSLNFLSTPIEAFDSGSDGGSCSTGNVGLDGGGNSNCQDGEERHHVCLDEDETDASNAYASTANTPLHTTQIIDTDNELIKHVTQRIDARTNHNIFTGTVDAITGYLIHGQMVYRQTGEVYEGPFLTKFLTAREQCNVNGEETTESISDTISLRHGLHATCRYSNGMKFIGSFEYDRPKAGTWIGEGWTYEGPLMAVAREEGSGGASEKELHEPKHDTLYGTFNSPSGHRGSINSTGNNAISMQPTTHPSNTIGMSHPLPGMVLFHGKGTFARADGTVYHGEFQNGLANGVGRETLPHERGEYCGEFCNGLRHGIGTLVEVEEESVSEEPCGCQCLRDDERRQGGQQGELSGPSARENETASTTLLDDADDATHSPLDPGPDFAAGGAPPSSFQNVANEASTPRLPHICNVATPQQCTCHCHNRLQQSTPKKRTYSSGVWCAGQYEIEDCRGTVHPESSEFTEETSRPAAKNATTASGNTSVDEQGNANANAESSLNRTTWDLIDEKWLGI